MNLMKTSNIAIIAITALVVTNVVTMVSQKMQDHTVAELQRHLNIVCDQSMKQATHNGVSHISFLLTDGTRGIALPDEYCDYVMAH